MEKHIIIPVDLNHEAAFDLIFPAAKALALHHRASLHFLTVIPDVFTAFPYVPRSTLDDSRQLAEKQLADIAQIEMTDDIEWESQVLIGSVAPTIVGHARDIGAGLIAIVSHDPKVTDILLGGVADRVLRRAHCSVLVLRAAGGWQWSE